MFLLGQFGYFCGFGMAGMVFPQPGTCVRIIFEFIEHTKWRAVFIDGNWRRAGRVDTDADNLVRVESAVGFLRLQYSCFDSDFSTLYIISGILSCQVMIGWIKNNAGFSGLIFVYSGAKLIAISDINY